MTTPGEHVQTLDVRSYLRPVWRRRWLILVITLVAGVATYAVASHEPKSYSASTQLYVLDATPTLDLLSPGSAGPPSPTGLQNLSTLLTAAPTTAAVAKTVGQATLASGTVTATPSTNSTFITITATSRDPRTAALLANTYASVFQREQLAAVASAARKQVAALRAQAQALPAGNAASAAELPAIELQITQYQQVALQPSSGLQRVNSAAVPSLPASPRPKRDAAFGAALGLLLALLLAFGLERLDSTLATAEAAESLLQAPVLTTLPHVREPSPAGKDGGPAVPLAFLEALRSLSVVLGLREEPPRTMIVTSALAGDGKSTVTRALALTYAQSAAKRVLVIDADLRAPGLATLFGVTAEHGLAHVAAGETTLPSAVVTVTPASGQAALPAAARNGTGPGHDPSQRPPSAGSVDLLAHGRKLDNPLTVLTAERFSAILAEAREIYDVVLVDTPPLLVVADAVPLVSLVDGVLLVTRLGRTTRAASRQCRRLLAGLPGVRLLGLIANDQRERDGGAYGSYYAYTSGRYSTAAGAAQDAEPAERIT